MKYNNIWINILRLVLIVSIIFWMMVIFGFSSADGETSQSTSDMITERIVECLYEDYEEMPVSLQQERWDNISFVVRKTGHFCEYGILAVLISALMLTYKPVAVNKKLLVFAVILCGVYAITDEVHQGFVAGRSPKIMDVCIDSAGAACGAVFVGMMTAIFEKFKRGQKDESVGKLH